MTNKDGGVIFLDSASENDKIYSYPNNVRQIIQRFGDFVPVHGVGHVFGFGVHGGLMFKSTLV